MLVYKFRLGLTSQSSIRRLLVKLPSKKIHLLTVNEKVEILELHKNGKVSVKELVKRFQCGKTQIHDALKNKVQIVNDWVAGKGAKKRKGRLTSNEDINEAVWE